MLIPIYTIVALINIFAKTQNFNFNPPKNLPYEIRVRRDLINISNYTENIPDIKTTKIVNDLDVDEGILKESVPKNYVNDHIKPDVELKINYDNTVPVADDNQDNYQIFLKNPLNIKHARLNEETKTLNNRGGENISSSDNSDKNLIAVNLHTIKTHNLIPKEIDNQYGIRKSFEKRIQTLKNDRLKKYKPLMDYFRIMENYISSQEAGDKRTKRNLDSNSYNQNNNNYNNQNDNIYNYHVTEKSTFDRAFNWVKNLVNSHEKYIITNDSASYSSNNMYGIPYAEYGRINQIVTTPNYNWNNGNNNSIYSSGIQNSSTVTSSYNGDNYKKRQYPYYGYSNYGNITIQNTFATPPTVTPSYNGIRQYNYNNQPYPYYGYGNYTLGNIYNGSYSNTNYTGNKSNFTSYSNNTNSKFNYSYTSSYGNGYNYTYLHYNYSPFPVYNETKSTDNTTTEDNVVLEGCVFCATFGCPKFTKRVGFKCMPIKH